MSEIDFHDLYLQAGQVFQPATPIRTRELFAGRLDEIARVADAIGQLGLHVAVYGERGVGKTSLANVLSEIPLNSEAVAVKVNCDATDDFGSAWLKFETKLKNGEAGELSENSNPNDVQRFLESQPRSLICIFDEFDRMTTEGAALFSDLIKTLSDTATDSTVVVVGVAETVTDLVDHHSSIERSLVQVQMPRMTNTELNEILTKASRVLGVTMTDNAKRMIVKLSQGLPHYTHLLGRESVRAAASKEHLSVGVGAVREGIETAIEGAQETIRNQYFQAVRSSRDDALYGEVLLACALAKKGDRSTFRAGDISKPMSSIRGKEYKIPAYAKHLKAFSEDSDRARILKRSGKKRNFIYRFSNPLMESYVLMRGIAEGKISDSQLDELSR